VPWMVMGVIFLFNLVLWWVLMSTLQPEDQPTSNSYNGGSFFLFVYMLVIATQAMNRTFPFALGFGVTRRDYYLGTSLAFVIYSVCFGAALTLLSLIEQWTSGWGVGLALFRTQLLGDDNLGQVLFVNIAGFVVFFLIGMVCGTVFVRWRANGLVALGVIVALLAIGSIALATLTNSWGRVGEWFVSSGAVGVTAWLLLFSLLFGFAGFFILRRATPKN
ncbi:MAG: ABC transporter permease, partial [Lacisediminihabitans sp.]